MPKFNRIVVNTYDEENYFKKILHGVDVTRPIKMPVENNPRQNILLILSINVLLNYRMVNWLTLVTWAKKKV